MSDERELRQQIAAEAQLGASEASPAVRAFQFFLVPLIIVALGFLLYWGFSHMVANPRKAEDWLKDVKEGGLNTRPHAALKLVETLRRAETPDRSLTPA